MNDQGSIESIQKTHSELYGKVIKDSKDLIADASKRDAFIENVKNLLEEMRNYTKQVSTVDDYRWLSESAANWQTVLASTLNIPIDVGVFPLPLKQLLPSLPRNRALTETELNDWKKRLAEILGISRLIQLRRTSSSTEMERDWYNAQVYLASDILDGFPNFASRIGSDSYCLLEEVWVKSVKKLRAYFIWQKEDKEINPVREKKYYFMACEHIRNMLVEKKIKAKIEEFGEAKAYIESQYLSNGKIDMNKPAAQKLIARKAERIGKVTGESDGNKNAKYAETYVRMFYESIIPAVLDTDEEKILTVLKAFQYSKAPENGWWIINCFEVALATYFLDADIIENLWTKSAEDPEPESSIESIISVQSWPEKFDVPEDCKEYFEYNGQRIIFKGLMREAQKESLLKKLKDVEHITAINDLFRQSRLIHRNTTL